MKRCWPASWRSKGAAGLGFLLLATTPGCRDAQPPGAIIARFRNLELVEPVQDTPHAAQRPLAEQWLRDQVMAAAALDTLSNADSIVRPLVERYRTQLLRQLQRQHALANVDTVITEAAVQGYYQAHLATFRADLPYVRYRVARIPQHRVPPGLVSRLGQATPEELEDWRLLCVDQPEAQCRIATAWSDLPGLGSLNLPDPLLREATSGLVGKPLWALQRTGSTEFVVAFVLLNRVMPGEPLPLDIALPAVAAALRAQRTNDFLQAYENRLLQQALQSRDAQLLLPAAPPR